MFAMDHDLHLHSTLSSCCHVDDMTPDAIADWAQNHGYRELCLTNHLWDKAVPGGSDWYLRQDVPHLEEALPLPQRPGLKFFFGCEAEYCGGKKLSLAEENFGRFDMIVVSTNHMHMKGLTRPEGVDTPGKMAELFTTRLEELLMLPLPWRKVGIAHLNIHHLYKEGKAADVLRLCDRERWKRIFRTLAERGAGLELNAAAFATAGKDMEVHLDFFRLAKECGCKFYCASDAHKLEALDMSAMRAVVEALCLTENDRYVIPEASKKTTG